MAKLPEGLKQHRSQYGTTTYTYKGVHIGKYRSDYSLRAEYLNNSSGKFHTEYNYGSYRLADVPAMVEKWLSDENYILDELTGTFKLTEARKSELISGAHNRVIEEIEATEALILESVGAKDWERVQKYAQHILNIKDRNSWALELERAC